MFVRSCLCFIRWAFCVCICLFFSLVALIKSEPVVNTFILVTLQIPIQTWLLCCVFPFFFLLLLLQGFVQKGQYDGGDFVLFECHGNEEERSLAATLTYQKEKVYMFLSSWLYLRDAATVFQFIHFGSCCHLWNKLQKMCSSEFLMLWKCISTLVLITFSCFQCSTILKLV